MLICDFMLSLYLSNSLLVLVLFLATPDLDFRGEERREGQNRFDLCDCMICLYPMSSSHKAADCLHHPAFL